VLYAAVFLLSLASLAYEVLLPRIFAFTQWHHLAFLVISVVVFGFGAGGAAVSLTEGGTSNRGLAARLADPSRPGGLGALSLLFCLSAFGSLGFLLAVPLDYFRLPVEARQAGFLALTWLLLLLPFLLAGAVQALAFAALPERSGWLYAAGMAGGACGALLPVLLLGRLGEARLAMGCLALPALPWILAPLRPGARRLAAGLLAFAALAVAAAPLLWPVAPLRPSPYKLLAQAGQLAGTRLLGTENSLAGRVDWLDSPALRFVPGMSLAFPGGLPQPEQAVLDGDTLIQLFPLKDPARLGFCRFTTTFAAYALREDGTGSRALLLLESGGLSLPCAVAAGMNPITVVVRHPAVARRLQERNPGLRVVSGNPRSFLASSRESFGLVQLESWGASVPGAASLNQDHLLTLEAFTACLRLLAPDGLFSVSRRIQLPPSDCLRLLATAVGALKRLGVEEPARNIAMLRSWDTYTLIASRRPFSPRQLVRLRRFCEERSFDLLFLEGLEEAEANRFIYYERPYHYLELRRLAAALARGDARRYYREYLLEVRPATDERPFPSRFLKAARIGELYRATGRRPFSLLLSGEAVVLATLALALAIGLPLLLLPLRRAPCRPPAGLPARLRRRGAARQGCRPSPGLPYFLACGAGYMLVEMGVIQDLTLVFAEPVTAVACALAVLLVFSGAGAASSAGWKGRNLIRALAGLLGVLAVHLVLRHLLLGALLTLPPAWRLAATAAVLAPIGFLMGVPLPVGLRLLGGGAQSAGAQSAGVGGGGRAYAWAANGIAGVLASVLALPLAMSAGIRSVYLAGAAGYVVALLAALLPGGFSRGPGAVSDA
jgi:hypothetical protein